MPHAITKDYLQRLQYGTTKYLEARMKIHQRFSSNPETIHAWAGRLMPLERPVRVLEVGCGTGPLWRENASKLPEGSSLVLTDFSAAMVDEARRRLDLPLARFEVADVEALPYPDDRFDVINAHHMLYHASDKDAALGEIIRVLAPGGYVTITTNSERHMRKIYDIGHALDANFPSDRIIDSFTEEIADEVLPRHFSELDKHVEEGLLKVDDLEILLDYVASGVVPRGIAVASDFYERYAEIAGQEIEEHGYFGVTTRSVLYIARP